MFEVTVETVNVEEQQLYLQPSHAISKAEPSHPAEKTHFSHSYSRSYPFSHWPELMTTCEGWNVDRVVNGGLRLWLISLFTTMDH